MGPRGGQEEGRSKGRSNSKRNGERNTEKEAGEAGKSSIHAMGEGIAGHALAAGRRRRRAQDVAPGLLHWVGVQQCHGLSALAELAGGR